MFRFILEVLPKFLFYSLDRFLLRIYHQKEFTKSPPCFIFWIKWLENQLVAHSKKNSINYFSNQIKIKRNWSKKS